MQLFHLNQIVVFQTAWWFFGLATPHNKEMKQVRGVDQTPYQSWHSPLRWATSYAHEVAPLLDIKNSARKTEKTREGPLLGVVRF